MKTYLPTLWPRGFMTDPFEARDFFKREFPEWFGKWPTATVGAGAPAMNVSETDGQIEATVELPGVDEKDIKVTVDGNRLVISGEKKEETKKDEKDWHIEERTFGSFMRTIGLPFEPKDEAVAAYFDKGVLHLTVKKPLAALETNKNIEIKLGAPPAPEAKIVEVAKEAPKAA
ncbi:MAG: Hsp20/alpha crystallin family protein [Beijerinckiaceae bacterium]